MPYGGIPLGLTGAVLRKVQESEERERKQRDATFYDDLNKRLDVILAPPAEDGWKMRKHGHTDTPDPLANPNPRPTDGVGGPEGPTPAWATAPVVEDTPQQPAWASAPVVDEAPQPGAPAEQGDDINRYIEEAVSQIPGGYKSYLETREPLKSGFHYERDPLAKGEKYIAAPDDMKARGAMSIDNMFGAGASTATDVGEAPWNEKVASSLEDGARSLTDMTLGPNPNNLPQMLGTALTTQSASLLPMLFRDPAEFVRTVDPGHQLLRANKAFGEGVIDATQGDWSGAGENAVEFLGEGSSAAMGLFGAKYAPAGAKAGWEGLTGAVDRMMPGGAQRAVDRAAVPVLEAEAGTLASVVTDAPVRDGALDAIVRILKRADVPADRIATGLRAVVDVAKEPARRPATVAQLLQREFGEEFPQVVDHINTVVRERGLTREKGDGSPTIVRDTTQAMRGSQSEFLRSSAAENLDAGAREVLPDDFLNQSAQRNFGMTARERLPDDFLSQSADRNFGSNARLATLDNADANKRVIGQEGYDPILRQPVDDQLAEDITEVLLGPGMNELMQPLRQIAAGEGRDLVSMITENPVRAAHWVQHKARLKAEEHARKDNDTAASAYRAMRGRVLDLIDNLADPATPNYTYRHAREEFGDEVGRQTSSAFGNRFLSQSLDPLKADQLARDYGELTPAEQASARESVRDAIKRQLNMGRPGAGPDAILSRPAVLQQLENVFGEAGRGFANDMRTLISHDQAFKFGDSFLTRAADDFGAGDMRRLYAGMSAADKQTALQSVRDAVLRQLKSSGDGQHAIIRRPAVLQQIEEVFGQAGKGFADDVRRVISHEEAFKFGDDFLYMAADDFKSGQLKTKFAGFTDNDKRSALQSTRDAIVRQLNMARPGGGARVDILGKTGVLHQLEEIFGAQGKAVADDIRSLVGDIDPSTGAPVKPGQLGENEFLQATTNHRQSATMPNAEALEKAPGIYGSDIANSAPATIGADAAMMMSGLSSLPILTAMRHGPKFAQKLLMPGKKTLTDMTRVLMARQADGGGQPLPPAARSSGGGPDIVPGPVPGSGDLTAAERAMLWEEVDDPVGDNLPALFGGGAPEAAPAPAVKFGKKPAGSPPGRLESAPEIAGGMTGGLTGMAGAPDANKDGEVSAEERAIAAFLGVGIGAGVGRYARHVDVDKTKLNAGIPMPSRGPADLQPKPNARAPWVKVLKEEGFDDADIGFAGNYMQQRFAGKSHDAIAQGLGVPAETLTAKVSELQAKFAARDIDINLASAHIPDALRPKSRTLRKLAKTDPRADDLKQSFDEDATTESLRAAQQEAVKAGKVPPVFRTFKMPDGRVMAWDAEKATHEEVRDILQLGDTPLQHGQFKWNDDLAKSDWYAWSGDTNRRPRPLDAMVRRGQKEGRSLNDILMDATPEELVRDLRSIDAVGPGKSIEDYSYRRRLATTGNQVDEGGHSITWKTPGGHDARVQFGAGGAPGHEIVQFRIDGKTSNVEGSRTAPISEVKDAFDKATGILERQIIQRDRDVYLFDGSTPQNNRRYAQAFQRLGAPQGYVGIADGKHDHFAFIKQAKYDADVAAGRIDPNDWTIIPSKRGDKAVPDWRRNTGQFALPVGAGIGGGAALFGAQGSDEPRAQ